jgi:Domain of unknown function (DUF4440)
MSAHHRPSGAVEVKEPAPGSVLARRLPHSAAGQIWRSLMDSTATILPAIERLRLAALTRADVEAAAPLHAGDYQLITPNGSDLSKDDYLGAISAGELRYRTFEPVSEISVLGDAPVAVLRYQARISFDDGPGFICWHTDCYELRDGRWQAVWSQATAIA